MKLTSDWATERCDLHDMVSCADCLDRKRLRRTDTGEVRYQGDCSVDTFREVTGCDYDFAAEVLREAGFTPGQGTRSTDLVKAFESVGFRVTDVTFMGLDEAVLQSVHGRDFFVCGWTRSRVNPEGHAWTITGGKVRRDFFRHKRIVFKMFEVTA